MDFDVLVCALCWERFDSPGELAEHEQAEEDRLFMLQEPST